MKLLVGLGNPGDKYTMTRHNIGFRVIDELANLVGCSIGKQKFSAFYEIATFGETKVCIVKPQTYMNCSGESVVQFQRFYQVDCADILIIHDELDFPFGKVRLAFDSGAAGHNGVQSIIDEIGTKSFYRLRVGISKPDNRQDIVNYVLTPFSDDERGPLPRLIEQCARACRVFCEEGSEKVTQLFQQ